MILNKPTFGPAGNSNSFYAEGHKSTSQSPAWVRARGLDAFEYSGGNGIRGGAATFSAIGKAAAENGIQMSLHAPYYISLSGTDETKRLNSISYIKGALAAAELMGCDTIVIHAGNAGKISRDEAMALARDTLEKTTDAVGATKIRLGIETMGKLNQLGTLEEVLELCRVSPIFSPVVDFGHMNARTQGICFTGADSYRAVFDKIATTLGDGYAKSLHCHFSKIEYTAQGEKKHLTFEDTIYGPDFEPLAEAIIAEGVCPRIICESDGTMAEDALIMKQLLGIAAENAGMKL